MLKLRAFNSLTKRWRWINAPSENGSQSITTIVVPLSFDTPNLVLTGIPIYTPSIGDRFMAYTALAMFETVAWNGLNSEDTVILHVGTLANPVGIGDINLAFPPNGGMGFLAASGSPGQASQCLTTDPIRVMIDDNNGGDPGSTVGEGILYLTVMLAV